MEIGKDEGITPTHVVKIHWLINNEQSEQNSTTIGTTLLANNKDIQEEQLRRQLKEIEKEKKEVQRVIDFFAAKYNDTFTNEIAETTVLKAEHTSLLILLEEKEEISFSEFIGYGMGSMEDGSRMNAPEMKLENLSKEEQDEIKDLYKFLAKHLHPNAYPRNRRRKGRI